VSLDDFENGLSLAASARLLTETHGLDLFPYEESFLRRTIERRLAATRGETPASYAARLVNDPAEAKALHHSLRIGHSEFFRDPLAFALLEQQLLPGLAETRAAAGRGEIRVWSAGCAAGQEAWSVAILLDELTAAGNGPVSHRIFATDVSEAELATARAGVYSEAQVGNVRWKHLTSCFSRQGDSFAIASWLRPRVDFAVHDLLDPGHACPPASIYGDFDLVLCCNLLFYYRPQIQQRILANLRHCLAPRGWLVVGKAERQLVEHAGGMRAVVPYASVFQNQR
jgi:chemotaxis methyl-accepting protein methylase